VAVTLNSSALITIYGGSGFIGRHVVRAIAKTGARMRVGVRRPELAGHLQPLGGVGQINAVQANVRYLDSLLAAADGADAVVNLVGILFRAATRPSRRSRMKVRGTSLRPRARPGCSLSCMSLR
jgi:NADH dehydrogenase